MPTGVRCAETTRTSCGTSNSASASAAALITDQSESLPMITPTDVSLMRGPRGSAKRSVRSSFAGCSRLISVPQVRRGGAGPGADVGEGGAERGDVPDLAAGAEALAVEVDLDVGPL